jgi:thiamine biosynthesis lipoprotein
MCPHISVHRFSHEAMATFFEILVAGEEESYARQAASAAFVEIDRLEGLFSRFDPASEVSQANRLRPGEEMILGFETFTCLSLAEEARRETGGAFDVNVRAKNPINTGTHHLSVLKSGQISDMSPLSYIIRRPPHDPSAFVGLDLDLGGIGKGYALDRAIEILKEWSLDNVLLHGGTSTALAAGSPPTEKNTGTHSLSVLKSGQISDMSPYSYGWPVGVGGGWPGAPERVLLSNRALSGSGTEVKGRHVVDPRTGRPGEGHLAAWAIHASAALADAFSTAFLVMTTEEVEDFCRRHPEVWACLVAGYGTVRVFNPDALA